MPSTVNIAYTAPINPLSATPILSQSQVWAGLQRKVKRGQDFVAPITHCDVVEEGITSKESHPGSVPGLPYIIREAHFKPGQGPPAADKNDGKLRENCVLYAPNRVEFLQPDGSYVCNTISVGSGATSPSSEKREDLYMTYSFSFIQPDTYGEGKELDEEELEKRRRGMESSAAGAVESSIEAIREMVKDGRIGV